MIIEIYLSKPVEPVGDCAKFYIETNNQEFIQELKKYVCPVRLIKYLDQELENNEDILELISLEPEQIVDLKIDLSLASEKIIKDPNLSPFPTKYLEQTKHLDKYGNNNIYNCKLIYTSNTNPGISIYVNQEGKIVFGEEVIYFYDYKYDDRYSFRTSKVVSVLKEDTLLTIETLNSTYIFELFKDLEIPDYQVSKEFYEEHQKRMNFKSTKFLTKSLDGFINIIEVPKAMTKKEVIEYFKEKKVFVDFVLAPIEKEFILEEDESDLSKKRRI